MSSIFSKIVKGDLPSYKIAESDKFFAFLDIDPMAKGHVLVVPKEETDYIFDLSDELLAEMMVYSKKVAKAISNAIPCQRVGVMVVGLEVPHAHIHLIPINKESDMNLSNPGLSLEKEEFERIADAIATEFAKL
ncbi:HIT family protein [Dysgonomonas macrotermitis]|uniref:Histidine triad (HIT) family protein n=1 Tax=Dysgonomonas macrotermitis TaxID=1346286 RepID=A0A1M4TT41_9BACT|nr:HIT family protein [Dysgonomonas macrotermitis]SHE47564.1 histidine triad (HIT) family protein [Dysgonomonas macrotermitis]